MNAINRLAFCLVLFSGTLCVGEMADAEIVERSRSLPPARANIGPQSYHWDEMNLKLSSDFMRVSQPSSQPPPASNQPAVVQPSAVTGDLSFSYPTFDSQLLDKQLELYLRYVAVSGPPDVLIVGSSRSLQGVDPIALQNALADSGYPRLKIFNFGINGATARVVDLLLRKILAPEQMPRLIVWADGVRAFNSGRADRTYRAIVASPGYQRLIAGIRPALGASGSSATSPSPSNQPPTRPVYETPPSPSIPTFTRPVYERPTRPSTVTPTGPAIDPINFLPEGPTTSSNTAALGETGATLGAISISERDLYSSQSDSIYKISFKGVAGDLYSNKKAYNKATKQVREVGGYYQQQPARGVSEVQPPRANSDGEMAGFVAVSARFDPATYYQRFRRVLGQYDGDYASFRLQGEQAEALLSVVAFAQSRRIPLVIVNLPLTGDYLDAVRLQCDREFQQYMQRQALEKGFIFRDLSNRWLTQHDYFADPSHLNRYGAEAVSRQLARDRTIPWPTPR